MNFFSYKLDHDLGLAPNPFWGYCTLAVCKPTIRANKNLEIGDWIIGTGSKGMNRLHYLIYAMKVTERLTLDEYWRDDRFQIKKPIMNGSLVQIYGDNFCHKESGDWVQEASAHSFLDRDKHIDNDTSGENVLISDYYFYLGNTAKLIPDHLIEICNEGRNMKYNIDQALGNKFIAWVEDNFARGVNGDPIHWSQYEQLNLELD